MWWEYMSCGAMHSIDYGVAPTSSSSSSAGSRHCPLLPDCNGVHHPNLFFRCLSAAAATGLKNAFVIVQISRFQQIIGVYTLQAQTEALKVRDVVKVKVRAASRSDCTQGHLCCSQGRDVVSQGQCCQGQIERLYCSQGDDVVKVRMLSLADE